MRLTVIPFVALASLCLASCQGGVSFESNLDPNNVIDYLKPGSLEEVTYQELGDRPYISKGFVAGLSCQVKERDFIQICKVMHMSKAHIIFKELLPNVFSYIAINFVMAMRNAIVASVGIMLVGLAAYDPTNWGAIMNAARTKGLVNPNNVRILLYPLVAIVIFQVATLMLANGLDETLNPRLKVM